jgi:hypothetical protein
VDGEAFVITRRTIQHLNAVATMIWLAIEEPLAFRGLLAILAEIFPDVPAKALHADTRRTLQRLQDIGIAAAVSPAPASRRRRKTAGTKPRRPRA